MCQLANLAGGPIHDGEIRRGLFLLLGLKSDQLAVGRKVGTGFIGLHGIGEIFRRASRGGNEVEVIHLIPAVILLEDNSAAVLHPDRAKLSVVGLDELMSS